MNSSPPQPPFPVLAAVLSYLVPGLGQVVQGRAVKGLLCMVILLGMFTLGQAMGGWRNVYIPNQAGFDEKPLRNPLAGVYQRWHYAGQFFIGVAAWPALWQFFDKPMPEGEFWRDFQRGPRGWHEEQELNRFIVSSDKTPDLGWVYTVIAGMLNILVIYDAYAGPAFVSAPTRKPEPAPQEAAT
jgi:Family of unknown function (DUF6677)